MSTKTICKNTMKFNYQILISFEWQCTRTIQFSVLSLVSLSFSSELEINSRSRSTNWSVLHNYFLHFFFVLCFFKFYYLFFLHMYLFINIMSKLLIWFKSSRRHNDADSMEIRKFVSNILSGTKWVWAIQQMELDSDENDSTIFLVQHFSSEIRRNWDKSWTVQSRLQHFRIGCDSN